MFILTINGSAVELAEDAKLALKYEGIKDVEQMAMNRSQTFSIPLTPANRNVLGLADDPTNFGAGARAVLGAQLSYDGGQVDGTLVVSECAGGYCSASFVYGALTELQALKSAGKISDWLIPSGTEANPIYLANGAYWHEASRNFGTPIYNNGTQSANALIRYPSLRTSYVYGKASEKYGITFADSLAQSTRRIVLDSLNAYRANVDASVMVSRTDEFTPVYQVGSALSPYVEQVVIGYTLDGCRVHGYQPWKTSALYIGLRARQACTLEINGTNPSGGTSLRERKEPTGWFVFRGLDTNDYTWGGSELTDKIVAQDGSPTTALKVDLEADDIIVYGKLRAVADGEYSTNHRTSRMLSMPTEPLGVAFSCHLSGSTIKPSTHAQRGREYNPYYLAPNLPSLSVFEVAKAEAIANGGTLVYMGGALDVFYWDFETAGGRQTDIEDILISLDSVKRTVDGINVQRYEVGNKVSDLSERAKKDARKTYDVPNGTLDAEKVTDTALYGADYGKIGLTECAMIPSTETDDDMNINLAGIAGNYLVNCADTAITTLSGTYGLCDVAPVNRNLNLARICSLSTAIVVSVRMPAFRFVGIGPVDTYSYRGGIYYCTSATWADGVAKLSLQRYK